MLRAIRFAYRFNFEIDISTKQAIAKHSQTLLPAVSVERLLQEFDKMAKEPSFPLALISMHQLNLLQTIFPKLKDIGTKEIENRVKPLKEYPKEANTLLKLIILFPDASLDELLDIGKFLKAPNEFLKSIQYYFEAKNLFESDKEISLWRWAHLYSNPSFHLICNVFKAHLPYEKKEIFISEHDERYHHLKEDIKRIQSKIPVVNSSHLKEIGIKPGPLMGKLLKEAEKISINDGSSPDDLQIVTPHFKT